ncbi:MAG: hypothetical protein IKH07_06140 [Oscillospiraceae bacterium]|nr:hypothetical protein [Oscillospiraceae bacterium]
MSKMKLLICLLITLSICIALVGCGNQSSVATLTDQAGSIKTTGSDLDDPAKSAGSSWEDSANPSQALQTNEAGKYRHEIDGATFYTQHSVDEWIDGNVFHAIDMANDIFGNGEKYTYGMGAVTFNINGIENILSYEVKKADGNPTSKPTDDAYPNFMIQRYYVYEYGNYGDLYLIDNSAFYIPYELLELSLYACEQLQAGNSDALGDLNLLGQHIEIVN